MQAPRWFLLKLNPWVCALVLLLAMALSYVDLRLHQQQILQAWDLRLSQANRQLSESFKQVSSQLRLLQRQAELVIADQSPAQLPRWQAQLQGLNQDEGNRFHQDTWLAPQLEQSEPMQNTPSGSLTGIGQLPLPGSERYQEALAVLSLTPLMQTLRENIPEAAWVYYTSKENFLYLYPAAPSSVFQFGPEQLALPFYRLGLPEYNPLRQLFWTPPYEDAAGQGMMITAAAPVYDREDRFRGTVALDITLRQLAQILAQYQQEEAQLLLIDTDGQVLAQPSYVEHQAKMAHIRNLYSFWRVEQVETPWQQQHGYWTRSLRLESFPASLVLVVDEGLLIQQSWQQISWRLLFMGLAAMLVWWMWRYHKLAQWLALEASRDGLTGLLNRQYFHECLRQRLLNKNQACALIFVDLNAFKQVNDRFGHQTGDKLLQQVGQSLKRMTTRPEWVGRLGGDEFAMILDTEMDEVAMRSYCLRLQNLLLNEVEVDGVSLPVFAAVGYACAPRHGQDVATLLRHADESMYADKRLFRRRRSDAEPGPSAEPFKLSRLNSILLEPQKKGA